MEQANDLVGDKFINEIYTCLFHLEDLKEHGIQLQKFGDDKEKEKL